MPLVPSNSVTAAVFTATPPTLTDGQGSDLSVGSRNSLRVELYAANSTNTVTLGSPSDAISSSNSSLFVESFSAVYNGANFERLRTPNVFKQLSAVLITAETTIWTPAGGKKFRLMGFVIAQGVLTGAITLRDNTAGTIILTIPQNTVGVAFASPNMGNGILSAAANNVLTAQGVATETITGYFFGTEE